MDDYLDEYGCEPDDCGSDADYGRYFDQVQNGYGYYDVSGNFHWFVDPD